MLVKNVTENKRLCKLIAVFSNIFFSVKKKKWGVGDSVSECPIELKMNFQGEACSGVENHQFA